MAGGPITDGLVVVDKDPAWTSHDVVAKLRGVYGQKRVGHAGTLDPDATGVLLVGLGRVTRLMRYLQETTKEYTGTVCFGVATSTLDAAGEVLDRREMPLTEAQVVTAAKAFVGEIEQVPPMVSAIKIDGRRLHELARKGEEIERAARKVRISRVDVESFEPGPFPTATIHVECSSGTYIRTLAADLGAALGGPAHLGSLRRLRVGSFGLAESHPLGEIEADPAAAVLSPAVAMRDLEPLVVDADGVRAVGHGMTFPTSALGDIGRGPFAVIGPDGALLAVYERRRAAVKPVVVVAPATAAGGETGR